MSPTLSTVPLLLLAAYLYRKAHGQLIPVVMFMSIFEAASLVNVGAGRMAIGVQPAYCLMILAIIKALWKSPGNVRKYGRLPKRATVLITLFVGYAMLSMFVGPKLFRGTLVFNPRLSPFEAVPLEWNSAFLNQLFYIVLLFVFYLVAAYRTTPAELIKSINWFIGGAVCAACIAIYQFASFKIGLPFPSEILHTGTYAIFEAYDLGEGVARVNGSFPEASSAAFTLTVALALVIWQILSGAIEFRNLTYALLIITALMLTSSTTGYVCLLYIFAGAASLYLLRWKGSSEFRKAKLILAVPFAGMVLYVAATPAMRDSVSTVVHAVVLDKTKTSSYKERTEFNQIAIRSCFSTYGFGVGWGVNRASSLFATLLGNVGIPGSLFFCLFYIRILSPGLHFLRLPLQVHGATLFALGAALVDLTVATPDLVHCSLWLLFAVGAKLSVAERFSYPKSNQRTLLVPQQA